MQYLLDTTVFLEGVRSDADPSLLAWLHEVDEDRVFISILTIADLELHLRQPSIKNRDQLKKWLHHRFTQRFKGRILPIGRRVVEVYAEILARSELLCLPLETRDALLAATAEVHGLALVTVSPIPYEVVLPTVIRPSCALAESNKTR